MRIQCNILQTVKKHCEVELSRLTTFVSDHPDFENKDFVHGELASYRNMIGWIDSLEE